MVLLLFAVAGVVGLFGISLSIAASRADRVRARLAGADVAAQRESPTALVDGGTTPEADAGDSEEERIDGYHFNAFI